MSKLRLHGSRLVAKDCLYTVSQGFLNCNDSRSKTRQARTIVISMPRHADMKVVMDTVMIWEVQSVIYWASLCSDGARSKPAR